MSQYLLKEYGDFSIAQKQLQLPRLSPKICTERNDFFWATQKQ